MDYQSPKQYREFVNRNTDVFVMNSSFIDVNSVGARREFVLSAAGYKRCGAIWCKGLTLSISIGGASRAANGWLFTPVEDVGCWKGGPSYRPIRENGRVQLIKGGGGLQLWAHI